VTLLWRRKWTRRPITHSWASPKNQISAVAARRQTGRAASGLTSGSMPGGGMTTRMETKKSVQSTGDAQRTAVNVFE